MMINRDHDINQVSHGINYKTTIKFPPTTKTPAFTSVILFNYSTSEKRSYGWQILRISIPPLNMDMFFNNNKKSWEQS